MVATTISPIQESTPATSTPTNDQPTLLKQTSGINGVDHDGKGTANGAGADAVPNSAGADEALESAKEKVYVPAPIPKVNVWKVRRESLKSQNRDEVKAVTNGMQTEQTEQTEQEGAGRQDGTHEI